jgi:nitrogen fixation NifU-like protein
MPIDLYAEDIIAQYEHPHNKGRMENASISMHDENPLCGDGITMHLKIEDGKIEAAKFEGVGCAVSIATASMLTDFVKGKGLKEAERMNAQSMFKLIGFDPGPVRLKCVTLSLKALKEAIFAYQHKTIDLETRNL